MSAVARFKMAKTYKVSCSLHILFLGVRLDVIIPLVRILTVSKNFKSYSIYA